MPIEGPELPYPPGYGPGPGTPTVMRRLPLPGPSVARTAIGSALNPAIRGGVSDVASAMVQSLMPGMQRLGHLGRSAMTEAQLQQQMREAADPFGFGGTPERTPFQQRGGWFRENPPVQKPFADAGAERGRNPFPNPYPFRPTLPPPPTPPPTPESYPRPTPGPLRYRVTGENSSTISGR